MCLYKAKRSHGHMLCLLMLVLNLVESHQKNDMVDTPLNINTNSKDILQHEAQLIEKFPFLKSSCVKQALAEFLPRCLKEGFDSIDSHERVETAVKLSICEFEASGLQSIPKSCLQTNTDIESMMDCMLHLESSTKWWTTYSGNYQKLPTICYENSLPYEKEQLLDVYVKLQTLYGTLANDLENMLFDNIQRFQSSFDSQVSQMLKKYWSTFADDSQRHRNDLNQMLKHFDNAWESRLNQKSQELEIFLNVTNSGVSNLVNDMEISLKQIYEELKDQDIRNQIKALNAENLKHWDELTTRSNEMRNIQEDNLMLMENQMERVTKGVEVHLRDFSNRINESQYHTVTLLSSFESRFDIINSQLNTTTSLIDDIQYTLKDLYSITKRFEKTFKYFTSVPLLFCCIGRLILGHSKLFFTVAMVLSTLISKFANTSVEFRYSYRAATLTWKFAITICAIMLGSKLGKIKAFL